MIPLSLCNGLLSIWPFVLLNYKTSGQIWCHIDNTHSCNGFLSTGSVVLLKYNTPGQKCCQIIDTSLISVMASSNTTSKMWCLIIDSTLISWMASLVLDLLYSWYTTRQMWCLIIDVPLLSVCFLQYWTCCFLKIQHVWCGVWQLIVNMYSHICKMVSSGLD